MPIPVADIAGAPPDIESRSPPGSVAPAAVRNEPIAAHADMGAAVEVRSVWNTPRLGRLDVECSCQYNRSQCCQPCFHFSTL
jgi:hypothetical protein